MIKAEIVAHSLSPQGDELVSVLATMPRIILAELNTHRMLSKNSASSRAIPFKKMVEAVQNNPFVPIAWQKEHKGMQGNEYITDEDSIWLAKANWLRARDYAIDYAKHNNKQVGVTKQLCNRLLEPFMWHTVLITGNVNDEAWINFFKLRCPQYQTPVSQGIEPQYSWKDLIENHSNPINLKLLEDNKDNWLFKLQHNKGQAEIHMMALAEAIYDAIKESTPKQLQVGEWHIPFEDKIDELHKSRLDRLVVDLIDENYIKVSTAMAARTSYTVVGEEKEISYEKLIELHNKMYTAVPFHASPFEHCARAMDDTEYESFHKGQFVPSTDEISSDIGMAIGPNSFGWCRNYKGFIQYRHILETKK